MECGMKNRSNSSQQIYWLIFQAAFVWSLIGLVIWLTLTPRYPNFSITNIDITKPKASNSTLNYENASLNFDLEIQNPNKRFAIYYDAINITFYRNEDFLGKNSTWGFYQGQENTSIIQKVVVNAENGLRNRNLGGNMTELTVVVETTVRYKMIIKKMKQHRFLFKGFLTIGLNGTILSDDGIKLHGRHG